MNTFPIIPKQEFFERQAKVQQMMKESGTDLLIAYGDDRAVFGQAHLRWLFNYQPHFEPACVLIPSEGEPVMLTGMESEDFIKATSYCENVEVVQEFNHPEEEYPFTKITSVEKVVNKFRKDLNHEIKRVGIAGLELMPYKLYHVLEGIFGAEHLVDMELDMVKLRTVKSPNEIRVIEYAYSIAQQGMEEAIKAIAEGRTEREVAAAAEFKMRSLGSEGMGIDTIVASGKQNTYAVLARTTLRKIEKGDIVLMTIAPRYEGYHGAIARTLVLGQPTAEVDRALKVAAEALQSTSEALKPGVAGYEIDKKAREAVNAGGLGKQFVYSGIHSLGVIEFEPPILSSRETGLLQENMVISIDIPLFFNDWGGLRIEDGFLITDTGSRPLQTMERLITRI